MIDLQDYSMVHPVNQKIKLLEREINLAASIQAVTEDIVLKMATFAREQTGKKNLCLSGGVALNCVANGKLQSQKIFEKIWIQPASGDAGGALGAALFLNYQLLNRDRKLNEQDSMFGSYLGPKFNDQDISSFIEEKNACSTFYESEDELLDFVAQAIIDGKIIGWFQGRMEFGPRALGRNQGVTEQNWRKTSKGCCQSTHTRGRG